MLHSLAVFHSDPMGPVHRSYPSIFRFRQDASARGPGYKGSEVVSGAPIKAVLAGSLAFCLCTLFACNGTDARAGDFADCPESIPAEMACVPGGPFIYGSNNPQWPDEHPEATVEISTFLIDRKEVTTKQYRECTEAGACKKVISNYLHMRDGDMPQVKVSWYDARDYCNWKGKRLPTEAEFEKASRGPDGNTYPWGNEKATCELAVIKEEGIRGCSRDHQPTGSPKVPATRPPGIYGIYDMSGNVHEWVADWYTEDRRKCGKDCLGKDPAGPCAGGECTGYDQKVVKGGSWYWDWDWARAAKRRAYPPANRPPHHFGFRCARSLPGSP